MIKLGRGQRLQCLGLRFRMLAARRCAEEAATDPGADGTPNSGGSGNGSSAGGLTGSGGSNGAVGNAGGSSDGSGGSTSNGSGGSSNGSGGSSNGSGGSSNGSGGSSNGSGGAESGAGGAGNESGAGAESGGTGNESGGGGSGGTGQPSDPTECGDGIDNDGDGYVDWQSDLGCYGPGDGTETSGSRQQEDGFTTFDVGADSKVVYVSADGNDSANGATPATAVKTLTKAASLVRDGQNDFMLLRRGDTWRDQVLNRFKSGKDATHPIVISSYGDSTELPRIEVADNFIDHDGETRASSRSSALHLVVYPRDPADPDYTGAGDGILRYVGNGKNLLIEGCHFEFGEIIIQRYGTGDYEDVEVRRNVVERRTTPIPARTWVPRACTRVTSRD